MIGGYIIHFSQHPFYEKSSFDISFILPNFTYGANK
jgi:hypothetical protein